MLHYGDPDWYERYVGPLRAAYRQDNVPQVSFIFYLSSSSGFLLVDLTTGFWFDQVEPPQTSTELKDELARLREQRLAKKAAKPVNEAFTEERRV